MRARCYRSHTATVLSVLIALTEFLSRFARTVEYVRDGHVLVADAGRRPWQVVYARARELDLLCTSQHIAVRGVVDLLIARQ